MSAINRIRLTDIDLTKSDLEELPDGQSKRFTHVDCSDSRNGAAYRSGGGVTLKCFKCGASGYVFLGIPSLYASAGSAPRTVATIPTFTPRYIQDTNPDHAKARTYLGSYGMTARTRQCFVDEETGNLALKSYDYDGTNGWCIRQFDPTASSKWMNFYEKAPRIFVVNEGKSTDSVVIVEDPISALKVWQYTRITTIALLGLNLDSDVLGLIAERHKAAVVWTDQDWSGLTRGALIRDGLQACMPAVMVAGVAKLKDPKDHSPSQILHVVERACKVMYEETKDGW